MPIIYFFGADGSGKTTLARLLCADLTERGFRVKYSWMRGSHTLASLLSRFLSHFKNFRGGLNSYYGTQVPKRMLSFWYFLEYVSALPIILLRFVLPSSFGYAVIADRYVLDLVAWVALITNDNSFSGTMFARHLVLLASKSDYIFFVVADLDVLVKRSGESADNLSRQLEIYGSFARATKAHIVDTTTKSSQELLKEIQDILKTATPNCKGLNAL